MRAKFREFAEPVWGGTHVEHFIAEVDAWMALPTSDGLTAFLPALPNTVGHHEFQERLLQHQVIVAPGVYDPLTASLAAQAGFEALYLSGAAIAYTRLGRPDIGLVSMSEVADTDRARARPGADAAHRRRR